MNNKLTLFLYQKTITIYFTVVNVLVFKTLHNTVSLAAQQCNLLRYSGLVL